MSFLNLWHRRAKEAAESQYLYLGLYSTRSFPGLRPLHADGAAEPRDVGLRGGAKDALLSHNLPSWPKQKIAPLLPYGSKSLNDVYFGAQSLCLLWTMLSPMVMYTPWPYSRPPQRLKKGFGRQGAPDRTWRGDHLPILHLARMR